MPKDAINREGVRPSIILKGVNSRQGPSFSLSNRFLRVLWGVIYIVFFVPTPRVFHAWRRWILRLFGATIGAGVHVYPRVRIWAPWNLSIGDFTGVANGVNLYSIERITLGERCTISQGAQLCTGSHDYNHPTFQLTAKPIIVGSDAWVCSEVFVCPGIHIAPGAVVGARSVVTRSLLDEWTVYAGMPARKISLRVKHGEPNEQSVCTSADEE
ncbi:putative colanic acid biosynthesis acetyltransferase WcaF [Paraburkholderia sp. HC6.4b]|uniref:putative colanic acid biosynthesis acetyltransferase n=1 Tax=unclassified Paraburkholderia TaxID=2615204 RepID=UPI0017D0011E|nr:MULTISPECIES: putative colanic acid biosynthesis acetyltransferase [unclassified Paraburkholderia]MBB5413418.1 putative colanic acid biosynthesis acetyltransferase WcaF [Paraburkholderia sp. HC6.4b]MBB5455699.1 putative colanic acid biosynthesis acetyltransferase WcaF [Paraburkholderia sp. Kb1A]